MSWGQGSSSVAMEMAPLRPVPGGDTFAAK